MDYKVLLLTIFIATVVAGQTTQNDDSDQTSALSEQEDPTKVSEDSSTESTSSAEKDEDEEDGDLKSSGTAARYTFTQADARTSLSPAPTNDLVTEDEDDDDNDDDDDGDEEAVETIADLEKILEDKANNDDEKADVKAIVSTTDDDDDDDDEEGDDDDDEDNTKPASESIIADPKSSQLSQLRRLGDLQPGLMTDGSDLDSEDKTPEAPTPVFVTNPEPTDSSGDGSPLLHLTQGGYQRPDRRFFGIYDQRQRMRTGSASQQSETLEAPQAQAGPLTPQVMPPYQPQSARPMFQNPFALPGGIQSGFFNTPPAGFTDFSSSNFQSPFHPAENGPYSAYPRDQNGFSLFQAPQRQQNQGVFPPNLPYQQQVLDGNTRPVQPFFHHPGGFPGLPNMDIVDDTPRPNYSPYMRPQPAAQFPSVYPNFYGSSVPNTDFTNAGVMSNLPRQSFQPPLYRYPDNPLTLQSSDQVDKQKQDGGAPDEPKDSDALTASQDKEDPTAVPFGARIKPGNDDSEVYLRYPIQEAGYATEENLPVQNTTEKSRNSDPSNPTFPFFAQPDGFRPFSNPDPYRNALNSLQQGYPGNIDNGNLTREVPADPFSNNSPVQFDERLSRPAMMFPPHHQREQVFQNRQFLPMPGLDARNPFYQLPGVQNNGFVYPPPPTSMRRAEDSKKTPSCAQGTNSTVCFEDADYPRRELIYAMNSDSFLVERLSSPNQVVEEIVLQDQKDDKEGDDNSICKSEIKYGLPLRARSVKKSWKVIVNLEKGDGSRQFIQPVRLEICKDANKPCSFTQVKTICVQKYSLQRLLSWSPARGIHTDVFRLPIACSCQVVEVKA